MGGPNPFFFSIFLSNVSTQRLHSGDGKTSAHGRGENEKRKLLLLQRGEVRRLRRHVCRLSLGFGEF